MLVPDPPVDPPVDPVSLPLLPVVSPAPLLPTGSPVVGEDALDVDVADPLVSLAAFESSPAVLHPAANNNAPTLHRPITLTPAP